MIRRTLIRKKRTMQETIARNKVRALKMRGESEAPIQTRSEAYVSDSGHAVCFFEGVRGWYLLERATPKSVPAKESSKWIR